jgi:polygalacturonase
MDSPNLDRVLRIKTNSIRGGIVENIFMRNIKVGEVAEAVLKIDFYYEEGDAGAFTPIVRNIDMENIVSNKSKYGLWIRAYGRSPASDIYIHNCVFNNVAESNVIENVRNFNLINVMINRE